MEGSDESMTWLAFALRYAELPAHQIVRLKNPGWNPTWQEFITADPTADFALNFRWGTRGKRSRYASTDAAAGSSPESPYDFGVGSGAYSSGGDDGSDSMGKRRKIDDVNGGCETMEEASLLADNPQHQKEIETREKAYEPLKAENQRLKNQQVNYRAESGKNAASTGFIIPDLNEPAPEYVEC